MPEKKNRYTRKILIIVSIIVLTALFIIFDLSEYLTLSYIKVSQQQYESLYNEHRFEVIAAFMAVYIIVTSLSLPGAAVMTIAAGALFGLVTGTIIVSFASTIGATLACFISRFILRDWIQTKFSDRLRTINDGVRREGAFYLFTLRLIPVFPFWLINLLFGLTRMPLKTFYWVSQAGMLPGTIVYVNAGNELADVESLSGIVSFGLILSFVLLGLFPLMTKKGLGYYRKKREMKPVHS